MSGLDISRYHSPESCPVVLRAWAQGFIGSSRRSGGRSYKTGRRDGVVCGWLWDGVSDEIVLLVAPKGHRYERIPDDVFSAIAEAVVL